MSFLPILQMIAPWVHWSPFAGTCFAVGCLIFPRRKKPTGKKSPNLGSGFPMSRARFQNFLDTWAEGAD